MRRGQSLQELKIIFDEYAEELGLGEEVQIVRKPRREWTPRESSGSQRGSDHRPEVSLVQKVLGLSSGRANTKFDETSLSINC